MRASALFSVAACLSAASAAVLSAPSAMVYKGFNYGSTFTDGSVKGENDFFEEFNTAKQLTGAPGFTSARLFTMIQGGTANTPTSAIQAAIDTDTTLLLGLWASAGDAVFAQELTALNAALAQYGNALTSKIAAISVGSEDLYRITPTGIANNAGVGAGPDVLTNYIGQVRAALKAAKVTVPVGHVDTWTAWVNGSNAAVINDCDFIGMDAYPYFQTTMANSIQNGNATFWDAYDVTKAAAGNKPVWITETGWPVSGPTENLAVPSIANAKTYWDGVGCAAFGKINTYWYTLQDAFPTTPAPSFGIVGSALSTTPLFNLEC
jgi:glucan endo-1,3-beta-D-glucosidase